MAGRITSRPGTSLVCLHGRFLRHISPPLLYQCEIVVSSGCTNHENPTSRDGSFPQTTSARATSAELAHVKMTKLTLLQPVTHCTQEAGVRSLERAIGVIARYNTVEWAAPSTTKNNLSPFFVSSSLYSTVRSLESAHVKCNKDSDVGYNPIVEADELEKIPRLSRYVCEDRDREPRREVIWHLVVSRLGEGAIVPSRATPGIGHLEPTGPLGDVRPELGHTYHSRLKYHLSRLSRRTRTSCQDALA
jgi:ATP-dependent Lon protease